MNFFMQGDHIDWAGVGVAIGVIITGTISYLNRRAAYRIGSATEQINDAVNHRHEKDAEGLKLYDMTFELFRQVRQLSEWKKDVEKRDKAQASVLADQSLSLSHIKDHLEKIDGDISHIKTSCVLHDKFNRKEDPQ